VLRPEFHLRIPPLSGDPREDGGAPLPSELQRSVAPARAPASGVVPRNADRAGFSSGIAEFV
jgi:hypothetical protein